MPTESTLQQKVARGITAGLLIGIIVWIALLVRASMIVRASPDSITYDITLGPISLTTIAKHVTDHDYTAAISPKLGLLWLELGCLAAGGLVEIVLYRRTSAQKYQESHSLKHTEPAGYPAPQEMDRT
jgi:hypothetical protein